MVFRPMTTANRIELAHLSELEMTLFGGENHNAESGATKKRDTVYRGSEIICLSIVIMLSKSTTVVGAIGFTHYDADSQTAEIVCAIGSDQRNQGYAAQALELL